MPDGLDDATVIVFCKMEKVLIITYYWPPSGGPGVQRWLKFATYLPSFGIQPVILTVDPQHATYPIIDESLVLKVPSPLEVFSTQTAEPYTLYKRVFGIKQVPFSGFANETKSKLSSKIARFLRGNIFVPDARVGWNRYAVRKAIELIDKYNIKTVITTSPPHSSQLIGLRIKKHRPLVRWIADLRDPWTDIYYYDKMLHLPLIKQIDARLEKKVLIGADILITVSQNLAALFTRKMTGKSDKMVQVITNGFDPVDFVSENREPANSNSSQIVVSYTGTMSDDYNLSGFLEAINQAVAISKNTFTIKITGSISPRWRQKIEKLHPNIFKEFMGHVSHDKALSQILNSDILLLLIPSNDGNKGIVTGKIFEYIASGRPVLGIGPVDGDASEILFETGAGRMFDYNDVTGIREFLLSDFIAGYKPNKEKLEKYSRHSLTRHLAKLIDSR